MTAPPGQGSAADRPEDSGPTEHADETALARLSEEEIELVGGIAGSSNETFLVRLGDPSARLHGVYKPELGERPLGDFPPGLHRRERAAYLVSRFLAWDLVPPTVLREDGPFGEGSLQLFIHHDPAEHYFPICIDRSETHQQLRRMAAFDIVTNNADRKGGHVLHGGDGRIWGIDNGLCFSSDLKLRTVIWDFAGDELEETLIDDLWRLIDEVPSEVAGLLDPQEVDALQGRARWLAAVGELPQDASGMMFPWPLI